MLFLKNYYCHFPFLPVCKESYKSIDILLLFSKNMSLREWDFFCPPAKTGIQKTTFLAVRSQACCRNVNSASTECKCRAAE